MARKWHPGRFSPPFLEVAALSRWNLFAATVNRSGLHLVAEPRTDPENRGKQQTSRDSLDSAVERQLDPVSAEPV